MSFCDYAFSDVCCSIREYSHFKAISCSLYRYPTRADVVIKTTALRHSHHSDLMRRQQIRLLLYQVVGDHRLVKN